MAQDQESPGQLPLELDCRAYQLNEQSFAPRPNGGGLFSCSVGPLPDETMTALDKAAREHTPVRLLFSRHPLLLEMVTLERKDAQRVRIVGFVIGASTATA